LPAGSEWGGKRLGVSVDGGRTKLRTLTKRKKGKGNNKTQRRRYRTDWWEPKLLIIVELDERGRMVTFERKLGVTVEDRFLLVGFEPVIARDPGVVFVDFALVLLPVVELTFGDVAPDDEALDRDLDFVGPGLWVVDDLVAGAVKSSGADQASRSMRHAEMAHN
jgi:hypothetical protein